MSDDYKYDVAFSFLSEDEPRATQLNDLVQDRLRTFLYSKKQGEIAGTDGEKTFGAVFGEQSRLVVVVYRQGWGQTPWTRIEETAIRNRAYDHGYDFVTFVPVEEKPTVPGWLPRTQLWVGLERWGAAGAASVIEARVQALGGEPHEETVAERAARLDRELKFEKMRKSFLESGKGIAAACNEFRELGSAIGRLIETANAAASSIKLGIKSSPRIIVILGLQHGVSVGWEYHYMNTLDKSQLVVGLWDCHPPFPGFIHFEEPRKLEEIQFTFDLLANEETCWVSSETDQRIHRTGELASFILKFYLDHARET